MEVQPILKGWPKNADAVIVSNLKVDGAYKQNRNSNFKDQIYGSFAHVASRCGGMPHIHLAIVRYAF